jgi:serine protease Do
VTVVELEADRVAAQSDRGEAKTPASAGPLGLAVSDLSDAQKRDLKVKGGVRVETAEGAAARAGIREGDVVLSLDNTEITGVKQFESVVGKLDKDKQVTALIKRGDWVNYIVIRPQR